MLAARSRAALRASRYHGALRTLSTKASPKAEFGDTERKMGAPAAGLPDFIEKWDRKSFYTVGGLAAAGSVVMGVSLGPCFSSVAVSGLTGAYWALGLRDMRQKDHTLLRNFPVLGHMRFLLESLRPEIRQYFIEADDDSRPFSRAQRSVAYSRAKQMDDTQSFGTRRDLTLEGSEFIAHSMWPKKVAAGKDRLLIGNKDCKQPYSASRLNISAMSYGALGGSAISALNKGAQMGGFYHNTGEGGISRFHNEGGGDLVWNVGTGLFGCRDPVTKGFDAAQFKARASADNVKMIEIKISQGAKPSHGGLLPGSKVTPEIAEARGIRVGETCNSPPGHDSFSDERGLLEFVAQLRELSGGKPVGFKICMGRPTEMAAIVAAMVETEIFPDFITLDGAEGGTGAAPPEFSNHVGWPLSDALLFVNNLLIGAGVREHVKIIVAGRILSSFSMVRAISLGADATNAARAFLFSLGCVQALKCNTNNCPTGITTLDPALMAGLDVTQKSYRVFNYHKKTMGAFCELVGAAGLTDPSALEATHIMRRLAGGTLLTSYGDVFPTLESGALLTGAADDHPTNIQHHWERAQLRLRGEATKSIPLRYCQD